jgi:hypothetical protein
MSNIYHAADDLDCVLSRIEECLLFKTQSTRMDFREGQWQHSYCTSCGTLINVRLGDQSFMYKKKSLAVTTTASTVETMNSAANTVGDTSIVFRLLYFSYPLYFFEIPKIFPLSQSVKISDNPRIVDFHCVNKGLRTTSNK